MLCTWYSTLDRDLVAHLGTLLSFIKCGPLARTGGTFLSIRWQGTDGLRSGNRVDGRSAGPIGDKRYKWSNVRWMMMLWWGLKSESCCELRGDLCPRLGENFNVLDPSHSSRDDHSQLHDVSLSVLVRNFKLALDGSWSKVISIVRCCQIGIFIPKSENWRSQRLLYGWSWMYRLQFWMKIRVFGQLGYCLWSKVY